MPEYIFTNLPQYVRITPRSDFSSSVVSSGAVLLFSEDGLTLTGKLPDGTFITIGGSSGPDPVGDATSGDILAGKSATVSGGSVISGTIPTVNSSSYTPGTSDQVISAGVYLGGSQTILGDANLVGSNIVSGASIFGVSGTAEPGTDVSDTTAMPMDVRSGAIFYDADGIRTTGTIPSMGAFYITPSTSDYEIPDGVYIDGGIIVKGDSNLVGSNILSGVSIFGVPGELIVSSGAEVTLGYITSGGQFQPLAFSGTSAADSGSAVTLSCYGWNLPGTDPSKTSSGVVLSSGNTMYVDSGWTYTSTTIYDGGRLIVQNGGIAQYLSITGFVASMRCSSGGIVNYATVDSQGEMTISGAANSTTINEGGVWIIGTANYTVINSGGSLSVNSSGLANSTTVNPGGKMVIGATGSAADILVSSGGTLTIVSGAVFTGLNNLPGAVIINS